jgi:hypothetical protein
MMNLLVVAFAAWSLAAQEPRPNRPERPDRPDREEFEDMMGAYVLSKLQDALELTDEQFGRMVVAQKKLQDTRRAYRRDRGELIRDLRRALGSSSTSDAGVDELLSRLKELDAHFREEERARYEEIDALLDLRQRARYRILEVEIQRRLQELVQRVRKNQPRP